MSLFNNVRHWDLVVMFCLLGAICTFEMLGVFSPRLITLTQIIKACVPMPCRVMVLAWLVWHFCVSDIVKLLEPK